MDNKDTREYTMDDLEEIIREYSTRPATKVKKETAPLPQQKGDTIPVGKVSADTIPIGKVGSDTVPIGKVSSDTVPIGKVGSDTIPLGKVSSDTVPLGKVGGDAIEGIDIVLHIKYAPAPLQFAGDGGKEQIGIVFQNIGSNGLAVGGGIFDDGKIPNPRKGHIEGAGDGGGAHGEHVDPYRKFLDLFFMLDAKALLFIDDEQAQLFEF